jgi:hypothetical protein
MERSPGQCAVITGGQALARHLSRWRASANVVLAARPSDLDRSRMTFTGSMAARACRSPAMSRMKRPSTGSRPRQPTRSDVDILVNNAGVGKNGTLSTLTTADSTDDEHELCDRRGLREPFSPCSSGGRFPDLRQLGRRLAGCPTNPSTARSSPKSIRPVARLRCYRGTVVSVIAPGGTTPFGFYPQHASAGDPRLAGFHAAEDVAAAVVFAAAQPPRSRVFMVWMRPMNESLGTGGVVISNRLRHFNTEQRRAPPVISLDSRCFRHRSRPWAPGFAPLPSPMPGRCCPRRSRFRSP